MSSPLLLLLHLLLGSLSSNSCNASRLRAVCNGPAKYSKHDPTLVRPKLMQSLFGVLESQLHQPMKGNGRVGIASSEESSDSEDLLPRDMKGRRGAISGAALIASLGTGLENLLFSSDVGLGETTILEETGRQSRSVLGFGSNAGHVAAPSKDSRKSNVSDVEEDIVDMDYEQPHRKPPIHNEAPEG